MEHARGAQGRSLRVVRGGEGVQQAQCLGRWRRREGRQQQTERRRAGGGGRAGGGDKKKGGITAVSVIAVPSCAMFSCGVKRKEGRLRVYAVFRGK